MSTTEILKDLKRSINTGEIFSLPKERLEQFVSATAHPQAFTLFGASEFPIVCETARQALAMRHSEDLTLKSKREVRMTDPELELAILRRYVEQYDAVGTNAPKCEREMNMNDVLLGITGQPANEELVKRWHARLAPCSPPYPKGVLRPCSDSTINTGIHQYHARAYYEPGSAPAWERITELESLRPDAAQTTKEKEQKFGILYSLRQASLDFEFYCIGLRNESAVGVIFLDIDSFKLLNTRFTESVVDKAILAPFQILLGAICAHRAEAYRYGGEEFLVLVPNQTSDEVAIFAERLREKVATEEFTVGDNRVNVTISIGIALFPNDGDSLEELIVKANAAEHEAKGKGKNRIAVHGKY